MGQHQLNVGNYSSAFDGLTGRLGELTANINPAAMAVAGISAAMVAGAKAVFEVDTSLRSVQAQFQVTGEEANRLNEEIRVVADVFGKDYNEVIQAGNALSKQFGISGQEALEIINQGFEKGADSRGNFLDQISEYSTQFKTAGLSASEMVATISQTENMGLFSDKGIDAIKEATVSLREMTPATASALNAIGLSANEIQTRLAEGSASFDDIIREVSTRLGELPPQSAEVGTAIADIFRGPGEDAGLDFILQLQNIQGELGSVEDRTTDLQRVQNQLVEVYG